METTLDRKKSQFDVLDSFVSNLVQSESSPGCVIGIVSQGELIYSRGFGLANLEHNIPITSETVFRIASVSKQFTAACIVLLEEEGKLKLDDYITDYFSEFPDIFKKIKIIHLLNHTSGLRDYLWLFNFAGYSSRALDLVDENIFLDMMIHQKALNFEPGSKYMYSNSGYVILSLLVKRISGLTLREYADSNIFSLLQMNHTHFVDDYRLVVKNRARAYTIDNDDNFIIFETYSELVGDGAVFTTLNDMIKWAKNFTSNRLGKKSHSLNEKLLQPGILNNGTKINYALGLRITNHKGLKQIYHSGMIAGFRSSFMIFPEENLEIICFANVATINPENVCNKIVDILLVDKIQSNFLEENTPAETISSNKTVLFLDEYIGTYRNIEKKQIYTFYVEDDQLVAELYSVDPLVLYSKTIYGKVTDDLFKRLSGLLEANIEFIQNGTKQRDKLIVYEDNGEKITLERIDIPDISVDQLEKYAGRYYSEELDTYYNIKTASDHLVIIIKRIEKIQLNYYYVGDNEFTCNQACIKFIEDAKGINRFELSTLRIPNPIVFVKEHYFSQ